MKVVMSELLTGLGSRTSNQRKAQKLFMNASRRLLPKAFTARLSWEAYQLVDAAIALTPWEKQLMVEMFDAPCEKVHVVPNGVEEVFFARANNLTNQNAERENWLICTATITERKRVLELAEAAILAEVPVWIIGTPYSESDPYYLRFIEIVKNSSGLIRYEGGISDRSRLAEIYRSAQGFVLLSTMESLSLSALEAAASGCPLLLSDLPWAHMIFGNQSSYCPITNNRKTAEVLKAFFNNLKAPSTPPSTWMKIAGQLKLVYERVLNTCS